MSETNNKEQNMLYSKELFDSEMEMIDSEIQDLDNLYKEIKTHFDGIKNSQARGSLVFVKDQTSNLISLKTAKLSYIKQKADMKKNITEFAFKEKASNKQDSEVDTITEAIYKKISKDFKYTSDSEDSNEQEYLENNDIENILDEELDDEDIGNIIANSTSIENVEVDYNKDSEDEIPNEEVKEEESKETDEVVQYYVNDERPSILAVDLGKGIFYKLDRETFDIIEELGVKETIVDEVTIEGDVYAIGESGEMYLSVEFEE